MNTLKLMYHKSEQLVLGITGLVFVLLLWQIASILELFNPLLLSSPAQIITAGMELTAKGELWGDVKVTIIEFGVAFVGAALIGLVLGLVMGWFKRVEYAVDPFIWFLYSTPLIAFYPLLIIWFGLGFNTVVVLGFLFAVIPITVNTFSGVKGMNPILVRAARSFGANDFQILTKVALPSAMPMIITGWRIGVERALIGVVVGEMFCSNAGLGFRISYYGAQLQTANLFVALIVVVVFGLILTQLLRIVEARLLKWQK
ncbi:ABC transporter permease [Bacillus sp. Marseille-P3661]|uniref:ABC transporter permease n=1 Tax=Bacillus sp. Marseille-P3661 TaxID=1936234 RepID=UPI000C85ACD0|nr:ABC transporter permease [Bacillus sp. Marseille-P3661]